MTRLVRQWLAPIALWRPLAPFTALFVLLLMFAVGGMLVVAHEADRSDSSRAREAVTRAFDGVILRLRSAAEMNAAAPPIASALAGPRATPQSAYGYLNFTNPDALGYHGTLVLNHDGSVFAGTRFGLPWRDAGLAAAARIIAPIAARLSATATGSIHAIVRDERGKAIVVAVANAMPSAEEARVSNAPPPRRLAMIAPIDFQVVPKMLPSLGVKEFKSVAASNFGNVVKIPVENGIAIDFSWRSRNPGRTAIIRWAPAIGVLFFAALVMLVIAGHTNISALRALDHLAHHDSLTGLANRAAFLKELDGRRVRGDAIAVGMIDLNGFKAVNDEYGHPVGDKLLQSIATELARSAKPRDFVARLGGDEFAWISPSATAATTLAADFAGRLARPLVVDGARLSIGAAAGIALAGPEASISDIMTLADTRLYENKHALSQNTKALAPTITRGSTPAFAVR